jgi:hypothetical protein
MGFMLWGYLICKRNGVALDNYKANISMDCVIGVLEFWSGTLDVIIEGFLWVCLFGRGWRIENGHSNSSQLQT